MICPEDDVIDYMVMEAVALKAQQEDKEKEKATKDKQARDEWKQDLSELEQHR